MILVYALSILIAGVWALRMITKKRVIFKRTAFDIPLALFLLSQIIATIVSMHPRTSVLGYYSRFHGGLLSWLSYTVLYYAFVSNIPRKAYLQLFFSATISAMIVSVYGILEHFGNSPSCLLLTKGQSFGVDCWIQKVQERVFATFGQPNWLAAYLITLLPVTTMLSLSKKLPSWQRMLFGGAVILELLTLLFTGSRSGFLGFVAGLMVLVFSALLLKTKPTVLGVSQKWVVGLAVVTVLALGIFGTPFSPSLSTLLKPASPAPTLTAVELSPQPVVNRLEVGGTDSGEIRKIVWQGALDVWRRYPVFGSGTETFAYSYYQDRPVAHNLVSEWDFLYNKAHNEFLNFLATTGVVGLGSYLLLLGWFGWVCIQILLSKKHGISTRLLVGTLLSGIVAQSVSNFFGFSTVMVTVLLFIALAVVAEIADTSTPKTLSKQPAKKRQEIAGLQYLGITGVVIISFFMLARVYLYWSADVAFSTGKSLIRAGQTDAGIISLASAIKKSPSEALFYDELSSVYASAAVQLAQVGEATAAAQTAETAVVLSDKTLQLNDSHLTFYKTCARVFITLSQLEPSMLEYAEETLLVALDRSPTDAKLWYNLGVVQNGLEKTDAAREALEKTVALKPNYGSARIQLGQLYEATGATASALEQYTFVLEELNAQDERALEAVARISTQSARFEQ